MTEQSRALDTFLEQTYKIFDVYSLQYQALSEFYFRMPKTPEASVHFNKPNSGQTWREPIPVPDAMNMANIILASAAVHATVMLVGVLDYYLYRMTRLVYIGDKTEIDRSWFRPDMIEPATGVNPAACMRYLDVVKMYQFYYQFIKAEEVEDINSSLIAVGQNELVGFLHSARLFAVDFERALVIKHPKMVLP